MGASAIIGGAISGGLGLLGSSESANAQESAASTAAAANQQAAQLQYQEWLQQQANMQPWLTSGRNALSELDYRMGLPYTTPTQGATAATGATAPTPVSTLASGTGTPTYYDSRTGQYSSTPPTDTETINSYGGASNISVPLSAAQMAAQGWTQTGGGGATAPAASTPGFTLTGTQGGLANPPAFSFSPQTISQNPDYQFTTQQGINALAASGAAAGNYGSGNMGTALEQFGQGNAATYENQYYNQALDTYGQNLNSQYTMPYNFLAGMSGTGQTAANSLANMGQAAVSNMGNYGVSGANALGAGQIGASNAYNSGINTLLASLQSQSGYGGWLNSLFGGNAANGLNYGGAAWNPSNYSLGVDYSNLGG
jgi:hypothetical protein